MPASSESVLRWAPSRGESSCAHCTSSPEGHKGYIPYEPYSAICESPSLRESPPRPRDGLVGQIPGQGPHLTGHMHLQWLFMASPAASRIGAGKAAPGWPRDCLLEKIPLHKVWEGRGLELQCLAP